MCELLALFHHSVGAFRLALKTLSHSVVVSIQETASQLTDELPV